MCLVEALWITTGMTSMPFVDWSHIDLLFKLLDLSDSTSKHSKSDLCNVSDDSHKNQPVLQ